MARVAALAVGIALGYANLVCAAYGSEQVRARDLGIEFEGIPGPLNAITDIPGVEVGHRTHIEGEGKLQIGVGPVRTGVTVVLPRGSETIEPVYGGSFTLNGSGEMTGQSYVQDFGLVFGPIGLSNTNAVGQVYAGIMRWSQLKFGRAIWPVVSETSDGDLNDIKGFHVTPDDAVAAIEAARAGPVQEGNVGGGTGMVCFNFKGGIGTASRRLDAEHFVGVLVQCNTGARDVLRISGVPVGREMARAWLPCYRPDLSARSARPKCRDGGEGGEATPDNGSIVIIVATNAPLTSTQLARVARRAALGLGRLGSYAGNLSGDFVVAFSTETALIRLGESERMDAIFQATVEATEEAIVNALVSAETMTGINGYQVHAIPHEPLRDVLRKYNRLKQ